jgi:predicted O-methyltransferase YrrM
MPALLNRLRRGPTSPIAAARINEVLRLKSDGSPAAHMLAEVLFDSRNCPAAPRIEAARRHLEASTTPLDYPHAQTVGAMAKLASVKPEKAALLHSAVKIWRPSKVLEMGTCCGVSGAYLISAGAPLLSLELSPILADAARAFWAGLGLSGEVRVGDFADTFEPALDPAPSVVFVDGNHLEEPTWDYFQRLTDVCPAGSLLLFDDIAWSDGMRAAWSRIKTDSRVAAFADMELVGMVVTEA